MFRFEGPDFPYEEFRKDTSNRFHEIEETEGLPVKKGARELLSWLKESGANVGLASSTRSETVIRQLTHAGLIQYFDVIVGGEMAKRVSQSRYLFRGMQTHGHYSRERIWC